MNQPLAYVHPQAKIARTVVLEPFTTIHNNVVIGSGTWIGSNVTIMEGARIGKNCRIFPGAVISAIPQDLKFEDEETTVEIGDNVTIRECVTINRGTKDRMKTIIGDNCLIMAYCHIAHDSFVGDNCIRFYIRGTYSETSINIIERKLKQLKKEAKKGRKLYMASGEYLVVEDKDGEIYVDGKKILKTVQVSNGWIHVIDQIILPKVK